MIMPVFYGGWGLHSNCVCHQAWFSYIVATKKVSFPIVTVAAISRDRISFGCVLLLRVRRRGATVNNILIYFELLTGRHSRQYSILLKAFLKFHTQQVLVSGFNRLQRKTKPKTLWEISKMKTNTRLIKTFLISSKSKQKKLTTKKN